MTTPFVPSAPEDTSFLLLPISFSRLNSTVPPPLVESFPSEPSPHFNEGVLALLATSPEDFFPSLFPFGWQFVSGPRLRTSPLS